MIGFSSVLVTPQNTRATSPTARFFHVLNSKMRRLSDAFMVLGLGVSIRKDGSMALSMCSNPAPPVIGLNTVASGFQSHNGARTMIKVNTPTTPANGITPALARQQAIENALESALYFIRTDHPHYSLCLATARARRALSLLKQACTEFSINGRA